MEVILGLDLDKLSNREDACFPEWVENEQIIVACDEEIGFGGDGKFEELVVLRVAAVANQLSWGEPLSFKCSSFESISPVFDRYEAVKLVSQ